MKKDLSIIERRTRLRGKLRSHVWSIVRTESHGQPRFLLLCNGKPFPSHGPNHVIDFYTEPDSWKKETLPRARATYTSFDPHSTMDLCEMLPVVWDGRRLSVVEWLDDLKPGTRYFIRARANGESVPLWVEQMCLAACFLHGFRLEIMKGSE